jgi:hypothetical protein
MKLALGVLLLLPFAAGADQIFLDYEGTVSYDNPELDDSHEHAVGDHVAGRLIIDTAYGQGGLLRGDPNHASYGPTAVSYEPPYPGFVFAPGGDGYASYDSVDICKNCVADGAGGLLDHLAVSDDFFTVDVLKHDLFHSLGLEQSFNLTTADVSGPGEGLSAWQIFRGQAGRAWNFTLSHVSMRPGRCFAHS